MVQLPEVVLEFPEIEEPPFDIFEIVGEGPLQSLEVPLAGLEQLGLLLLGLGDNHGYAVHNVHFGLGALFCEKFLFVLEPALLHFEEVYLLVDFELAEPHLLREVLDALLEGFDVVAVVGLLHHALHAQQSVEAAQAHKCAFLQRVLVAVLLVAGLLDGAVRLRQQVPGRRRDVLHRMLERLRVLLHRRAPGLVATVSQVQARLLGAVVQPPRAGFGDFLNRI